MTRVLMIIGIVLGITLLSLSKTEAQEDGIFDDVQANNVDTLKLKVGGFLDGGEVINGVVTLLDSNGNPWTIRAENKNPSFLKVGAPGTPDIFTIDNTAKAKTFLIQKNGVEISGGLSVQGRNAGNGLARGKIVVANGSNTVRRRELLLLGNLGGSFITFFNGNGSVGDAVWSVGTNNSNWFGIAHEGKNNLVIKQNRTVLLGNGFILRPNGNLRIKGTLTELSDAKSKENFEIVEACEILRKLNQLPISTWNYKHDNEAVRHIGPTAQDFHRLFSLGEDDKTIASMDRCGVALAAVKGLSEKIDQLASTNANLKKQLKEKEQVIQQLDKRIAQIESKLYAK